jgi:hypothetical protein
MWRCSLRRASLRFMLKADRRPCILTAVLVHTHAASVTAAAATDGLPSWHPSRAQ